MRIRLQQLEHQARAIEAVTHVLRDVPVHNSSMVEANPLVDTASPVLFENIEQIQQGLVEALPAIPKPWRTRVNDGALGIDVRMETGTGKTYVYTKLMYELHKRFGLHKFIVLVPSVSIKEGTRAFIEADYARSHFRDQYGHDVRLQLHTLEPQKNTKGRKPFPTAVQSFGVGTRLQRNRIHALLMTSGMLMSDRTMDHSFDQMMLDSASKPNEVLRQTRPVVIIDEPHRFKRDNAAYKRLMEKIQPQVVIRFGATFPQAEGASDYNNLVYSLGAVESFNDRLVKGVAVQYPEAPDSKSSRLKLVSVSASKPKTATFKDETTGKTVELGLDSSLSEAHPDFAGISVAQIGKTSHDSIKTGVTLSNDLVLGRGDIVTSAVFSRTYQQVMLDRAIENHLDTEQENFLRVGKVKTLSLFFIDAVESYRADGGAGHLRQQFEAILTTKLQERIRTLEEDNRPGIVEYLEFLRASIEDVTATNGGYFSQDNSSADEAVQREVDQILRDKQSLLAFKDDQGRWNTRRFIFSKWTLREGWDNPNVFQIVKLRSSGSDISKLQEVGRGLRLPVDEHGRRLSDEQFYLTYLVDFSEENFANTLIGEVNSEIPQLVQSVKDDLDRVAAMRGITAKTLFAELFAADLIDHEMTIIEGKTDELLTAYPEFNQGVRDDKILPPGPKRKPKVKVREANFEKIKDLWSDINKRFYLALPHIPATQIATCLDDVLQPGDNDVHVVESKYFFEDRISAADNGSLGVNRTAVHKFDSMETIPYGEWLRVAAERTHVPVTEIHGALVRRHTEAALPEDFFSSDTLQRFVRKTEEALRALVQPDSAYRALSDVPTNDPLLTTDGKLRAEIPQSDVGLMRDLSAAPESFLFDAVVYDSPKERTTILESGGEKSVTVFGKIPRRSVRIPLYNGASTSPDFMYVVKDPESGSQLFVVIETKDVKDNESMRTAENARIEAAEAFFEGMRNEGVNVHFSQQLHHDGIGGILRRLSR